MKNFLKSGFFNASALYILTVCCRSGLGWHAYESNATYRCNDTKYISNTLPNKSNPYKLWRIDQGNSKNSFLHGYQEAMALIWQNQNPKNCSESKFLISPSMRIAGFGSEVHVEGSLLALALNTNRILLDNPLGHDAALWRFQHEMCIRHDKTNKECYYEPWSATCTIYDAIPNFTMGDIQMILNNRKRIEYVKVLRLSAREVSTLLHSPDDPLFSELHQARVLVPLDVAVFREMVPHSLKPLLDCGPMKPQLHYYWWRAISVSFLLRPNPRTLSWLEGHHTLPLTPNQSCVSVYVRRGDKVRVRRGQAEMEAVPFLEYASAAELLWRELLNTDESVREKEVKGTMFLGSEDVSVLYEAQQWAKTSGWRVLYTEVIDRTRAHALTTKNRRTGLKDEYLAMILNLEYALQCDAWVCTLASNFCRLIDELRTTVVGKSDRLFADLSRETCSDPPCIGENIKSFDW